MLTVADIFKRIERIKKDLEYVRSLAEKWRDQRERFPKIYEGILEQERAFVRRIEEMRNLPVQAAGELLEDNGERPRPPAVLGGVPGEGAEAAAPVVEGGDKLAAAAGIEEKLRKRHAAGEKAEAGAY
ncbi:MAG: hypothetical protein KatS3mg102_1915 [Planctomycetota bacterium]|nr:MAG: hypothetical protein KatS3mg102_1915 [Planctomycetota bacterium]